MDVTKLLAEIKAEEGTVLHAYEDHLGYLTIGVGRLIDKRKGGGISQKEADYLLLNDVQEIVSVLDKALPWMKQLSDSQQRALCQMAFQMGVDGLLGFKTTLARLKAGDFKGAKESALKSKWATQTPARAERVTDMFLVTK